MTMLKVPVAAVDATLKVTVEVAPAVVGVTGFTLKVTVTPAGCPLADNVTA